ncbi:competence/damage-inducible protein A [Tyzzerella sp. OttesenSCG-928-J15]|nr:competence/damage-inducible protein A [Tyzzerella sp. OttesenSCG-928-J15]
MKAEILAVGTELLLGDTLNTNAQYLSKELAGLGIGVYHQTVVGDNPERLEKAFADAFERADVVITSGGLGPTKDDLTKETGAKYFGKKLMLDEGAFETLKSHFSRTGRVMTKNNEKQAFLPEGSEMIPNNNGTAPGCIINDNGKILIMLPGPPRELIPMFEETVAPYLRRMTDGVYVSRILRICGVGESSAEEMIKDLIEGQSNPTIAPYAKVNEVTFRITASAKTEDEALKMMEPLIKELYNRFGDNIYGEGKVGLPETVVNMLMDKKLTIATAESCTGGLLASGIVDVAGSSKVFKEGFITYSNEAKIDRIGVKAETLAAFGAVSKEVAQEMALGAAKTAGTDIGIGITGIAGPDGGTDEKPVGLVYVAVSLKGKVEVKELNYRGARQRIRSRAVMATFDMLRRALL